MRKGLRTFVGLAIFIFAVGCSKQQGVKNDSGALNYKEIENNITNTSVISQGQVTTPENTEEKDVFLQKTEKVGDNVPVSRGLAAKMLALAFIDPNSISAMDREINFTDSKSEDWYDRYINAAYVYGIMQGSGDKFFPENPLTINEAQLLLDKLDKNNKIKIKITQDNLNSPISYALWVDLYNKLLQSLSDKSSVSEVFGIVKKDIVVLATSANSSKLSGFNLITDTGPLTFSGLVMDEYIDKQIEVLLKNGEIICVNSVKNQKPTMYNCYITKAGNGEVTIFTGGAERTYQYARADSTMNGEICDITINNEMAERIEVYSETFSDTVKRTNETEMEFHEKGIIKTDKDLKIYSITDGNVKWKGLSSVIVGTDIADYIMKSNHICAVVINEKVSANRIRVAISATDFKSLYHDKIDLTATTGFTVKINGNETKYKAGQEFSISTDSFKSFITIKLDDPKGRFRISSIKRSWENGESPKYRGNLEILKDTNGLCLVNELPMEEYLYAVVPSEMPSSYGLETSKVQAITARSYAYNQFYANRYHKYGANVDDSVSCQVYNNIPENDISINAVNATQGQCLTFNGSVISANFFSTSSGMTANGGEVWADSTTKQFPTNTASYLKSKKQYLGDFGDLRVEKNAYAFFKDTQIDSYDSKFGWFRWNVEMTADEIAASINASIKQRYEANPSLIKTLQGDNTFRSRKIENIGSLKDIEILKRGEGGNILEMKITGSSATVLVQTEYNVRMLIKPYQQLKDAKAIVINRGDGTTVNNYTIMPSGFFVMDKKKNEDGSLASIKFFGGGNGHGVGMSQNGVKGMIDKKFSVEQILNHYFEGCQIKKMY